jgi:glycine cleavage system H protein
MNTPDDLRYSAEHEWVRLEAGNQARVGITDYAQDALGDIVYVDLPAVGQQMTPNERMGEIESTKSISELYAPVSGTVVAVNADLEDHPERVNSDPYGEGWICVVELNSDSDPDGLMNASAYLALTEA